MGGKEIVGTAGVGYRDEGERLAAYAIRQRLHKPRAIFPYDTAYHRLLLGVFESGLRDYLQAPKYRGDVRQWVNEHGGCAPFGFESACEYLGLNCAAAREAMRKWMKKVDTSERHGRVARHQARLHRQEK